jgi:hypothetical protein
MRKTCERARRATTDTVRSGRAGTRLFLAGDREPFFGYALTTTF